VEPYELEWARAVALTLAMEQPRYFLLLRREGFGARTALGAGLAANVVSHPLLWFAFPMFEPYVAYAAAGEAMVIGVEVSVVYAAGRMARIRVRTPRIVAVVIGVNAVSMVVGLVM
jgi:hypothetical protein